MKESLSIIPELFFDVIGILIPGAFLTLGILFMGFTVPLQISTEVPFTVWFILISYLLGHLLYSISSLTLSKVANIVEKNRKEEWLDPSTDSDVTIEFKEKLINKISDKWGLSIDDGIDKKAAYELCRNYIHINDVTRASFIRKEQAYGELSRSMPIVALIWLVLAWNSPIEELITKIIISIISIIFIIFFFWRYLQARRIDALFVFTNFLVIEENELKS